MNDTATAPTPLRRSTAMADAAPPQTRAMPQAQRPGAQQQSLAMERPSLVTLLRSPRVLEGLGRVAGSVLKPERLASLVINSLHKTPLLAQCEPKTVLGSLMASAALGLEPNTPSGLSYLIPYKERRKDPVTGRWGDVWVCQMQISYRGFITLAHRSKAVLTVKAEAIREGDLWDYEEGTDWHLRYAKSLSGRGDLLGAFCFTRHPGEVSLASVLTSEDIRRARSASETYRAAERARDKAETPEEVASAQNRYDNTPWVKHEDPMAAKTAIKRHLLSMPIWDDHFRLLNQAAAFDSATEDGTANVEALGEMVMGGDAAHVKAIFAGDADLPEPPPREEEPPPPTDDDAQAAGAGGEP
jgi:recombination protein RecT